MMKKSFFYFTLAVWIQAPHIHAQPFITKVVKNCLHILDALYTKVPSSEIARKRRDPLSTLDASVLRKIKTSLLWPKDIDLEYKTYLIEMIHDFLSKLEDPPATKYHILNNFIFEPRDFVDVFTQNRLLTPLMRTIFEHSISAELGPLTIEKDVIHTLKIFQQEWWQPVFGPFYPKIR